jgi:hypothetical protein
MKKLFSLLAAVSLLAAGPAVAQSDSGPSSDEKFLSCLKIALGRYTVEDLFNCEVWA